MSFTATQYKITAPGGGNEVLAPRDWTLKGSVDNIAWDTLDTVTGETFTALQEKTYTCDSSGDYRYYQFDITKNCRDGVPAGDSLHVVQFKLCNAVGDTLNATMTNYSAPSPWAVTAIGDWSTYYSWCAFDGNNSAPYWAVTGVASWWIKIEDGVDPPPPSVVLGPRRVSAKGIYEKLGDNAGAYKYVLQDSDDVEVFSVDSDGHIAAPTDDLDPATKKYVDDNEFSLTADCVKDTHIDWGSGAGQVDADDIGDGSTNAIPTLTQEDNWDTHISATNPHSKHVDTEGNETIAGIKTFSSFPVTPSAAPTTDYQVANKKYTDDQLSGGSCQDGCQVYMSTTQDNLTDATWTKVVLDSEVFDDGANFDSATNYRYVAPHDGKYLVTANVQWRTTGLVADKRYGCNIYVNGTSVKVNYLQSSVASQALTNTVSVLLNLTATDYIELYAIQSSGGNAVDIQGGTVPQTGMSIVMLYAT